MIWAPIEGYEGLYEVSSCGSVRNAQTGKVLCQWVTGRGYAIVKLSKDGKPQNFRVHRLVANAFVPNPDGLETVNHIDLDKLNNSDENLEWVTPLQNMQHYVAARAAGVVPTREFPPLPHHIAIRKMYRETGQSMSAVARHFGVNKSTVRRCIQKQEATIAGEVAPPASPAPIHCQVTPC